MLRVEYWDIQGTGSLYHPETCYRFKQSSKRQRPLVGDYGSQPVASAGNGEASNRAVDLMSKVTASGCSKTRAGARCNNYLYLWGPDCAATTGGNGDDQTGCVRIWRTTYTIHLSSDVDKWRAGAGVSGHCRLILKFADRHRVVFSSLVPMVSTVAESGNIPRCPWQQLYGDSTLHCLHNGLVEAEDHSSFSDAQTMLVESDLRQRARLRTYVVLSNGEAILTIPPVSSTISPQLQLL